MVLFCLPYAGGSSSIYYKWKEYLYKDIEIYPIELTGRGKRIKEPLFADIKNVTSDVLEQIEDKIKDTPYAFYGHSMGSLIIYELTHRIIELNAEPPVHIFFSGKKAPHLFKIDKRISHLPDNEFIQEIIKLGGTPKEIADNQELLHFFLPILRADFQLVETYKYVEKNKFDFDITIINGNKDDLTLQEIIGWQEHTSKRTFFHMLEGDHFFINGKEKGITSIINNTLNQYIYTKN